MGPGGLEGGTGPLPLPRVLTGAAEEAEQRSSSSLCPPDASLWGGGWTTPHFAVGSGASWGCAVLLLPLLVSVGELDSTAGIGP